MEIFDIVDEYGLPVGKRVDRSTAHRDGIRHRTAHIWVVRKNGERIEVLLQKRAMSKESFPGCYDTSAAGHIRAGDEPLVSAQRELMEELGIDARFDELEFAGTFNIRYEREFHGSLFRDNEISFVYICHKEINDDELVLQEEEVESVNWFDLDYLERRLDPRDPAFCVPTGGFGLMKEWCLKHFVL